MRASLLGGETTDYLYSWMRKWHRKYECNILCTHLCDFLYTYTAGRGVHRREDFTKGRANNNVMWMSEWWILFNVERFCLNFCMRISVGGRRGRWSGETVVEIFNKWLPPSQPPLPQPPQPPPKNVIVINVKCSKM